MRRSQNGTNPTFAEFFAGIGLLRLALERKGWAARFANDIDPLKAQMYSRNFPESKDDCFVLGDIHKLDTALIPTTDLATASFPCNDLSLAGARSGLAGLQSGSFWGFIQILKEMGKRRPRLVLLENVTGFLSSNGGKDFFDALQALNSLGYSCDAFILDAVNFVPQSRARLFVVGINDNKLECEVHEVFRFYESPVRPAALADFIFSHPGIRWSLRDLTCPPERKSFLADILDTIPHDQKEWWSTERASYLLSQMSPRHAAVARKMIAGRDYSYGTVFRRVRNGKSMAELRIDGVAGCLRTPRGGSGRQILFKAGRGKYYARLLTSRECARLQGVPDSYIIDVPLNQALFGFGDAVCVPVIEWIAENYLNPVLSEGAGGRATNTSLARS